MRDGWRQVTLGEVCTLTKGTTPTQKAVPGPYPLVVTAADFLSSDTYQFDGEAVCVPMVSSTGHGHASLKRVHYASGKFAVANIITALETKPDAAIDMRYLWLVLDHGRADIIVPLMKGTANVSLSQRALSGARIVLPPLDEQRRIVDLIGTLDEVIEAAERAASCMDSVLGCQRDSLLAIGGSSLPLGEVAEVLRGAVWTKKDEASRPTGGHEEVVGIGVTSAEGIDLSKMKYVRGLGARSHRLREDDILIVGSNGNAQRIGNAYWAADLSGRPFSAFQMAVRPTGRIPHRLIFHSLAAPKTQSELTQQVAGSTGLKNLGISRLRAVPLPNAAPADAANWLSRLDAAELALQRQRNLCLRLATLRAHMLTALLSGQHEIPESYDELLEVSA